MVVFEQYLARWPMLARSLTGLGEHMGKEYQAIDAALQQWMARQQMFFVATAPLAEDGLINCSPKGLDGLRVTGPNELVYADLGGSGIETVAHIRENERMVIMMCAFEGPPKIFRFYGRGRVVLEADAEYADLAALFPQHDAPRNFIVMRVERIRDACGYGVPQYEYRGERDALATWRANKTPEALDEYRRQKNAHSLDGLPGLDFD